METRPLHLYLEVQLRHALGLLPAIGPEEDIERLHRYRVALRRCRSLLRTYAPHADAFDAVLGRLLKSTNPLREIDVLVAGIDEERYGKLSRKLERYRTKLYGRRWNAETLRMHLNALHRLLDELDGLDIDTDDPAELTETAMQRYAEAKAAAASLHRHSDPETVHDVRLHYKAARYALEFLDRSGLAKTKKKIAKSKKVLARYGAIQDASDQLAFLKRFCRRHPSKGCKKLSRERKKALKQLKRRL
jgi:CHAD domain-containing protein